MHLMAEMKRYVNKYTVCMSAKVACVLLRSLEIWNCSACTISAAKFPPFTSLFLPKFLTLNPTLLHPPCPPCVINLNEYF